MTSLSQFMPAKWKRSLHSIFVLSIMIIPFTTQISLTQFQINFTRKHFFSPFLSFRFSCFRFHAHSAETFFFILGFISLSCSGRIEISINFLSAMEVESFSQELECFVYTRNSSLSSTFSINLFTGEKCLTSTIVVCFTIKNFNPCLSSENFCSRFYGSLFQMV